MPSSHIIHVPRTDAEGAFILGEVTSSGGSKPLNLRIDATEGDAAYSVKRKHNPLLVPGRSSYSPDSETNKQTNGLAPGPRNSTPSPLPAIVLEPTS